MKVAVIDQTGDKTGGAQLSLELFLRNVPADVEPIALFFENGPFADRIKGMGIRTQVVPIGECVRGSTRERLRVETLRQLPAAIGPLVEALRALRPDVVYTNGIKAHALGSLSARLIGRPSVVHHRDLLGGPGRAALLAVLATCSRARIATSAKVARCYPLPNTTVVDNPVDLARYRDLPHRSTARKRLGVDGAEPVAAIVGRINRWKGIDRFLRALAVVNRRTQLRGLIVGAPYFRDVDYLPELHALRAQLGLSELVTFADWVSDTRGVYAAIDINVNTSNREPFGRTVIEAAASGVPSVCFDDSGVSETMINGTTGLVVRAHDETALANALTLYAGDPECRHESGVAARNWSERFDAALHAQRVADILRRAAAVKRPRQLHTIKTSGKGLDTSGQPSNVGAAVGAHRNVDVNVAGATWEHLAQVDPMWAILTDPTKLGRLWETEEFFATGRAEVEGLLADLRGLAVQIHFERALDFGCGIGRVSRALARYCDRIDGVDIARTMVTQATERNRDVASCIFHLNEDSTLELFEDETFDLVYSNIVLQHLSPELAAKYIAEFARCARPGGIIVFQVPHARRWNRSSLRRYMRDVIYTIVPFPLVRLYRKRYEGAAANVAAALPKLPMQMNCLPRERVKTQLGPRVTILKAKELVNSAYPWTNFMYYARRN